MKGFIKRTVGIIAAASMLATLVPTALAAPKTEADSVYVNGNIYTVDAKFSTASALAVKGQDLIYVGNDKDAKDFVGSKTKVIDLQGKTVIPGIIEGHMHYPMLGEKLIKLDVFNNSKEDILKKVKAEADRLPDGIWIQGSGWNQELWPDKKFPTKEELDAVAPNNPVVLTRVDEHAIWVNSLALKAAGITKDMKNPQGGEIMKTASGDLLGVLADTAAKPVWDKVPALTKDQKLDALVKAQKELFSYGITSSMDAGSPLSDIDNMKQLYKDGKLKVRIYAMVSGGWGADPGDNIKEYYKKGPEIGLYDNRFTVRCLKLFADGSLGSRTAAMQKDYSDRANWKGSPKYTDDQLYALVKEARANGWQVATHAIGDASIEQVINTYEKVLKEKPLADHRYRIEHFQMSNADQIKRIAKLGILPAMQPTHATSDKNMAETRVGHDRILTAYAWRQVIDNGSIIIGGSDAPVELVNPYHGLYAAVTRMDRDGNPPGGWYPENKMTREEALKSFTTWAAFGQFEEKIKGSLETGKLADFVVLDRDPMKCPEKEIKDVKALKTVLGGEVVYEAPITK